MNTQNKHAIVIGGSMAGLLAARVLSNHFERVTVLERDPIHNQPESRKGQPHTRHLHALLAEGFRVMTQYFPRLEQTLLERGALINDIAKTMRWYTHGGYRKTFALGARGAILSRPLLEWTIREQLMALPKVMLLDECSIEGLLTDAAKTRVLGVRLVDRKQGSDVLDMQADLVIDASGRASQTPKWLEALGYQKPEESLVKANIGYATRLYRRNPDEPGSKDWHFITPETPASRMGGGAFPIEDERWIVTLAGYHGEHPQADEAAFMDFAKKLPTPAVYDLMSKNEPLSDIVLHKFPASLRRHYEKLRRFPEGFLVMGDAMCSFNPLYGQGMTVAALEAETLDGLLSASKGQFSGIAKAFFRATAKVIDNPWQIAVGADFAFPETEGKKAPGTDLLNAYIARLHRATLHDPVVGKAFLEVTNLITSPASLLKPSILWRVFAGPNKKQRPDGARLQQATR